MILAETILEKFHPKPSDAAVSTVSRDNFGPEMVYYVISGVALAYVSVDASATFVDYRSNGSRYIRLPHFGMDERRRRRPTDAFLLHIMSSSRDFGTSGRWPPSWISAFLIRSDGLGLIKMTDSE